MVYRKGASGLLISALVRIKNGITPKDLALMDVETGTQAGNIWTVRIPADKIEWMKNHPGIDALQLDRPLAPYLDEVRKQTRTDSVHKGLSLPTKYHGSGVVTGILDVGFDYGHPSFFDSTGSRYRVKRIWEQKKNGTPPAGYGYGNEITDTLQMWNAGTDNSQQSHGTHVTGIASGSGFGSGSKYRGIACSSDIVLVGITPASSQWENTGMADIVDGINYIFNYAASVGKPAVANLSWGCSIGPHDGSSLFSQACDNLTGPGRIFVCAAGNTGKNNLHLAKNFSITDTMVSTIVTFQSGMNPRKTWVDIWGDTSKTFMVQTSLFSGNNSVSSTGFISLDNNAHSFQLIGSNGDTCFIDMEMTASEFNLRPHALLNLYSKTSDNIVLSVKAIDGTINMWNGYVKGETGYYGEFTSGGYLWATAGNNAMTISDISSTRSAIAAAAYASKINFTNVSGGSYSYSSYVAKGNITPFSSRGPTADFRIKPDIAAPGLTIASALNSYDSNYGATGSNYIYVASKYTSSKNGRTYPYGMMSGTSMASPAVSGIVALLLEADPNLDPQKVKSLLAQTAIKDAYTGSIPASGSNTWGGGKINAMGAMRRLLLTTGVTSASGQLSGCSVYPNPGKESFHIRLPYATAGVLQARIFDLAGNRVHEETLQAGTTQETFELHLTGLGAGIYLASIISEKGSAVIRIVVEQ